MPLPAHGDVRTQERAAGCDDDEVCELLLKIHHAFVSPLGEEVLCSAHTHTYEALRPCAADALISYRKLYKSTAQMQI